MTTIVTFLLLFTVAAIAAEQQPIGSTTSYLVTTNNDQLVIHCHNNTSGSNWVEYADLPISLPHTYKDEKSGMIFFVEVDGRHITAISPEGKILWRKDPHADLEDYRTDNPCIIFIGWNGDKWPLFIKYNSSQCGWIDEKTGDFTFTGQL